MPRKHEVFRKSSFFLSTLRGEFEAAIHSDRIFARKSAPGRGDRDPAASIGALKQHRENPKCKHCLGKKLLWWAGFSVLRIIGARLYLLPIFPQTVLALGVLTVLVEGPWIHCRSADAAGEHAFAPKHCKLHTIVTPTALPCRRDGRSRHFAM